MEQQRKEEENRSKKYLITRQDSNASSSSSSFSSTPSTETSSSSSPPPSSLPKRVLTTSSSDFDYNDKRGKKIEEERMEHHSSTKTDLCFHTRLPRREKLGLMGIRFRQRLEDYIAKECTEFMHRQQQPRSKQPHPLHTGTSLSGLSTTYPILLSLLYPVKNYREEDATTSSQQKFPLKIVTSTMPRAVDTVLWNRSFPATTSPNLNPLDKGDLSGIDEDDIQTFDPQWFQQFTNEPYFTRYPGGECYSDLITRLEPVIIDVEQQTAPVLVVSHISTLQALVCYFRNPEKNPVESCMDINIPLHTVIKFTPSRGGGWKESHHQLLSQDDDDLGNEISVININNDEKQEIAKHGLSLLSLSAM